MLGSWAQRQATGLCGQAGPEVRAGPPGCSHQQRPWLLSPAAPLAALTSRPPRLTSPAGWTPHLRGCPSQRSSPRCSTPLQLRQARTQSSAPHSPGTNSKTRSRTGTARGGSTGPTKALASHPLHPHQATRPCHAAPTHSTTTGQPPLGTATQPAPPRTPTPPTRPPTHSPIQPPHPTSPHPAKGITHPRHRTTPQSLLSACRPPAYPPTHPPPRTHACIHRMPPPPPCCTAPTHPASTE